MKRQSLNGSCSSTWFYDLGGAHGVDSCDNLEEFANKLIDKGYNSTNFACISMLEQQQERQWLEKLGFKAIPMRVYSDADEDLVAMVASGDDIEAALAPFKEARRKKMMEQRAKRREEQARIRAERKAAGVESDSVRTKDVRKLLDEAGLRQQHVWWSDELHYPPMAFDVVNRHYGINIPHRYQISAPRLTRMINYRLSKND